MAPRIVEGIFTGGHVELIGVPEGIADGARVRVEFLPEGVTEAQRREAGNRLMARLRQGIEFGGSPCSDRESLYDRDDRS